MIFLVQFGIVFIKYKLHSHYEPGQMLNFMRQTKLQFESIQMR